MDSMKEAAEGLKLQVDVLESSICSSYDIGGIIVSVCKHSIQCIQADALIVAVKPDLYMKNSKVGNLMEAEGKEKYG